MSDSKFKFIVVAFAVVFIIGIILLFFILPAVIGKEDVERDELMPKNEATNIFGFPVMNSATNMYCYMVVGGLQYLDAYMRLSVSKEDLTNQINLIIAQDSHVDGRVLQYKKGAIDPEMMPRPKLHRWEKPILWWTPEKITNGYYIGAEGSYAPSIWVDNSAGTIFIQVND
jgi:hypothetical protein